MSLPPISPNLLFEYPTSSSLLKFSFSEYQLSEAKNQEFRLTISHEIPYRILLTVKSPLISSQNPYSLVY